MSRFVCLFLAAFLALPPLAAQDSSVGLRQQLLLELYGDEDLQTRMVQQLENNYDFARRAEDQVFVRKLQTQVRANMANDYVAAVMELLRDQFTDAEAEALLALVRGERGELVKRLFLGDNTVVESRIAAAMAGYVEGVRAETAAADSVLYYRELPIDLQPLMLGTFTYPSPQDGAPVRVTREAGKQTEVNAAGEVVTMDISWITNNHYIARRTGEANSDFGIDWLDVTVHKVEGNRFEHIVQYSDGRYSKYVLTKEEAVPPSVDAELFQFTLSAEYRTPSSSPLKGSTLEAFQRIGAHPFYPISADYVVEADLEVFDDPGVINLPTSAGTEKTYNVYAKATFTLNGKQSELLLYQSQGLINDPEYSDYLFLPFRDATSGKGTYGGGRYLDLRLPPAGSKTITLNFNKAYQPYCAYTDGYFCPVPPAVNTLPFAVEAGVQHLDLGPFD